MNNVSQGAYGLPVLFYPVQGSNQFGLAGHEDLLIGSPSVPKEFLEFL